MIEEKLKAMGLELPVLPASKGIYKSCLQVGNLIYVSGHVSVNTDGSYITGKLGDNVSDEVGQLAARQCGLAMLTSLKKHLGDLDRRAASILEQGAGARQVIEVMGLHLA